MIALLYFGNETKCAYYISEYFSKKNRYNYLKLDELDYPQELLENFSINNNNFKDIWNESEVK